MGIKEDTCGDEHWVLHVSDESFKFIPEIQLKEKKVKRKDMKKGREGGRCSMWTEGVAQARQPRVRNHVNQQSTARPDQRV